MAAARYQHYVREGGTHGVRRYLQPERFRRDVARHPFKYPLLSLDYLDYTGRICNFRALFGPERVLVWPFEQFRAEPVTFAAEFAACLDLELDTARLDYSPENAGFGRNTQMLARWINHLTYRSVLDKRYRLRLVSSKVRGEPPRAFNRTAFRGSYLVPREILGRELEASIRERFAEPNRRLAGEPGLPPARAWLPLARRLSGIRG
jgi:hypothetical protein